MTYSEIANFQLSSLVFSHQSRRITARNQVWVITFTTIPQITEYRIQITEKKKKTFCSQCWINKMLVKKKIQRIQTNHNTKKLCKSVWLNCSYCNPNKVLDPNLPKSWELDGFLGTFCCYLVTFLATNWIFWQNTFCHFAWFIKLLLQTTVLETSVLSIDTNIFLILSILDCFHQTICQGPPPPRW